MTRLRSAGGRVLWIAAAALAMAGGSAGVAHAAPDGPQPATFEGWGEDVDEQVAIQEGEADARARAAAAGFVDCSVIDVEILVPPSLPEPDPFPIETFFGARVTIACTG
jgi:hypothetical protein